MACLKVLIALLVISCGSTVAQQQKSPAVKRFTEQLADPWDEFNGEVVTVEGIAWGAHAKGLGQRLVLASGRQVYVRNIDYAKHDLNGRLLRLSGILRKERMKKAPPTTQGYGKSFDYHDLESLAVKRIDKVEHGQLRRSDFDWIVIGMDADAAMKLIARFADKEYPLSLAAARDGSKEHSYKMTGDEVLLFRTLEHKVVSVTKIKLNGFGKKDDDWLPLKGYRLPRRR